MPLADFDKGTKICSRCLQELTLDRFCIKNQAKDKLNSYCRECEQEKKVLARKNNPEIAQRKALYDKSYRSKKERREIRSASDKNHRISDSHFRKVETIRSYMNQGLSGKLKQSKVFAKFLNCTIDDFKQYIESKFLPGMDWSNRGKTIDCWSIDHIVPFNYFNLDNENELRIASNYLNCRPVWNRENLSKGANLPENYRDIIDMIKNNLYGN